MRKALFLFGILDDSDVEWLLETGRKVELEPGRVVIQEGQEISDLFLVIDGLLSVRVSALRGKEIARLMSGEVIGEMSFVDSRPPSASVEVVERSILLAVSRSALSRKLADDPPFAARFYRALAVFLANRLRTTVGRFGYGDNGPTQQQIDERDEIDVDVLDDLSLAGSRFNELQRRVRGISRVS